MSDILTINSTTINLANYNASIDRLVPVVKDGIPELHFSRILGKLTTLPDAWSGKSCTLTMSSILVFTGQVQGYIDRFMPEFGWVREYRALGLRNSADYVPNTDPITLTDTSSYNLPGDDPNYVGARAGLTVGQIVTSVLTAVINATNLSAMGVGAYTSFSPPTLPALTAGDLSNLSVIPQSSVQIAGERLLQALEAFVQSWHPNHWLHVQPDGTIRFLDLRSATPNTLELGNDPRLDMPSLTRDFSDCYSQVEVRGNTLATPAILQTSPWPGSMSTDGGIQEDFAWGSYTNSQAKMNYVPADYNQPNLNGGNANDSGTCTIPDTMHAIVTSSNSATTWVTNFWSQGSGAQGVVYLYADVLSGVSQVYAARIVACTAMSPGGSSTLTLDRAVPSVTYNSYAIWGLAENASVVYRKYAVSNPNIASALLNYFPYPVPVKAPGVDALSMTSTPVGFIQWSSSGSPPYNTASMAVTVDPVGGLIYFERPTCLVFGPQVTPVNNVMVFLPVANGGLQAWAPSSTTYSGTLFTTEGVKRTKVITVRDWRDVANQTTMNTFASEFLASVQDVVVEGTVPYHGLLTTFLTCGNSGQGVTITGNGYTTGYESLNLPVVRVEVQWNNGTEGTSYDMAIHLSNRRGRFTSSNFLRPNVTGQQIGGNSIAASPVSIPEGPTGPASAWTTAQAYNPSAAGGNSDLGAANDYSTSTVYGPGQAPTIFAEGQ